MCCFAGISYFIFSLTSAGSISSAKNFEIKSGQGLAEIAGNLEEAGIIRSKNSFEIYAIFSGSAHLLKPGNYLLDFSSSAPSILRKIVGGPEKEIQAVITEGMSLADIDKRLAAAGVFPLGALKGFNFAPVKKDYEFLSGKKSLEGFLFPDTYRFYAGSDVESVARKFLDNFNKKVWPILKPQQNFFEKLVLASLIEKEVPDSGDRKIVSGILLKRLSAGMALQVDATLVYAKCGGSFVTCENSAVGRNDLSLDSPYNTYLNKGFPPGPICNPGLDAISAALNPKKSGFLYYLSDPKTQKTIFSATFEEHDENRSEYLY